MKIAVVLGAATPPGRLADAVERMAALIRTRAEDVTVEITTLATAAIDICDGRPLDLYGAQTRGAVRAIAEASAIIIASPVYRASIPGVLKNLLDLLPVDALESKPVGILAMAASLHHYLAADSHLRQILAWFGALVAPTSVYLTGKDFCDGRLVTESGISDIGALADTVLLLARSLQGRKLGPRPLAAKFM